MLEKDLILLYEAFLYLIQPIIFVNSIIIFDEVQLYPKARSAIKYLVEDGRYDYI